MTTLCHWRVLGFIPHLFSAANSGMSAKPRPIHPRFALALRSAGRAGGDRSFASRPEEAVPLGAGPAPTLLVMQDVRAIHSSGCNHSIEIAEVSLSFLLPSFFTFFITSFLPASVPSLHSSVLRSFPLFYRPPFLPFILPSFLPSSFLPSAECGRELVRLGPPSGKKENFPDGVGWYSWFIRGRSGGGSCVILLIEGPARAVHPTRLCVRRTSFCDWRTLRAEDEEGRGTGTRREEGRQQGREEGRVKWTGKVGSPGSVPRCRDGHYRLQEYLRSGETRRHYLNWLETRGGPLAG